MRRTDRAFEQGDAGLRITAAEPQSPPGLGVQALQTGQRQTAAVIDHRPFEDGPADQLPGPRLALRVHGLEHRSGSAQGRLHRIDPDRRLGRVMAGGEAFVGPLVTLMLRIRTG